MVRPSIKYCLLIPIRKFSLHSFSILFCCISYISVLTNDFNNIWIKLNEINLKLNVIETSFFQSFMIFDRNVKVSCVHIDYCSTKNFVKIYHQVIHVLSIILYKLNFSSKMHYNQMYTNLIILMRGINRWWLQIFSCQNYTPVWTNV